MSDDFTPLAPAIGFTSTFDMPERGSFALTKDGPVLGLPRGTEAVVEKMAADRIRGWLDSGGLLTLPFPVDVYDAR